MTNKTRFRLMLIIVAVALVTLIDGHLTKAVCEIDPDTEVFGLYTATLDGNNMKPLITNSWQQMTHARISLDKQWVAFTRYNNIGKDGYATENPNNYDKPGDQYKGTEIMLMRADGSDVRTIIPHEKDKISANSYWTPDGKGLIYVSAPNEKGLPQINHIILNDNMEVERITKIPIPEHIAAVDPHWVGDWVVFPGIDTINQTKGIWRIRYNGENLELLAETPPSLFVQDNDPKFSPDGSKVAFMRRMKEGPYWHVFIVDVETKVVKDISAGYLPEDALAAIEGVPTWSGNGEFLIFVRIVVDLNQAVNEIHTMRPDGSQRNKIPLPQEYTYFHPNIFPGEGSDQNSRIIFSTRLKDIGGPYEKINIIRERSIGGAYDLALEYENSAVGWMVYTGIVFPGLLHTHLAKTTDNGKTWTFVKRINESTEGTVISRGQTYNGTWVNEVPTLVYDADDPGGEWKLYWHKYFSAEVDPDKLHERKRILTHSWIMYKYADSPEKLDLAEEIKLFSTLSVVEPAKFNFEEYFDNSNESVSAYSEPGSLYKDGVIYLALSRCSIPVDEEFATLFLVSSSDHGQTWNYIGKALDIGDAQGFDYESFSAASLAEEDGRIFLLIAPVKDKAHSGTYIFEFHDISKAELKRDGEDKLIIHKFLPPSVPEDFMRDAGQSDYDKYNTYGGIIMPQMDMRLFPKFANLYNTKEKIVEESFSPVSVIQSEPKEGHAPLTVSFDGSQSKSPHGDIVSYEWDFGDGSTSTGMKTSHIFTSAGEYTVTLTVTDDLGLKGESQTHIIVFRREFGGLPTSCYNNVFNPTKGERALIVVELPKQAHVRLNLYNTRGKRIRELADEQKEAGTHKYYWDGKSGNGDVVGSGLYFVHIQAGDYRKTKKIVVVK